jgi:SAM-dependent methyltransferase
MTTNYALPDWLTCPGCRGPLEAITLPAASQVNCTGCGASYDVVSGIPVLLDEATRKAAAEHDAHEDTDAYHAARHSAPANIEYYDFWCQDLLNRIPPRSYDRVVELMCGGAELSRRARDLPKPIVAIDLNLDLLKKSAKDIVPNVVPVCASADRLPFADGSLDLVLIQGGLHHMRRHVAAVLKEIARCLAKGAVIVASEPRNDHLLLRGVRRVFYNLHPMHDENEEDGFTRAQMAELCDQAGLTLVSYEPFAFLGYVLIGNTDLVPLLSRMQRNVVSRALVQLDGAWAKVPVARGLGWASQIVIRKV